MALNKDLVFGFNHSEQIDRLYEIMTSAQIKASFDKRGEDLKNYIYSIIDKLVSEEIESGASNIGLYPVNGLTAKNVQDAIKQLKEDMINVVLGDIPSGAISDIKLSDLEGQIKDKVNKLIIDVANNSTQLGEKATFKNGSGTFPI
ncbi:MAG: hypothetical protein RR851_13225, partial [Clostridium sp.]